MLLRRGAERPMYSTVGVVCELDYIQTGPLRAAEWLARPRWLLHHVTVSSHFRGVNAEPLLDTPFVTIPRSIWRPF